MFHIQLNNQEEAKVAKGLLDGLSPAASLICKMEGSKLTFERKDKIIDFLDLFNKSIPALLNQVEKMKREIRRKERTFIHEIILEEANLLFLDEKGKLINLVNSEANLDELLEKETYYLEERNKVTGNQLEYGDIVRHGFMGYQNEAVFIYDGSMLRNLSFSVDNYGTIPRGFNAVSDFPFLYFSDAIENNCLIWLPAYLPVLDYKTDNSVDSLIVEGEYLERGRKKFLIRFYKMDALTEKKDFYHLLILYGNKYPIEEILEKVFRKGTYVNYVTNEDRLALLDEDDI